MSEQASTQELVTLTVDGIDVTVPKGTVVIRAAEQAGIAIPRFCDHPGLAPVGACRQCLVEVPDAGNGRGFPLPQASCTLEAANGMQVKTQQTSDKAAQAQHGVNELLLINHPLDCPICDKGGECPLQNQALATGSGASRYDGVKRRYPKPIPLSAQLLLDRERCVLCTRCTRFADQIAGDPQIGLMERGAKQQVGISGDSPFNSYFAGNVVQICPVGALTARSYRFAGRPFDLVSTVTTCEGCAAGCQLRVDQRHYEVRRRLGGNLPAVNGEWNCDRGRFGFVAARTGDRLTRPLIRRDGELVPTSWPEAIDAAVAGLRAAGSKAGVLTGGRLTREVAYAYARFARTALGTNNIDCRARALSVEETAALTDQVVGQTLALAVTYADLDRARQVVLIGFEPEDEAPIVFLRLRRAVRAAALQVTTIAPYLSLGAQKLSATLIATRPGQEAAALAGLTLDADTIILAGERLATMPGAFDALARSGARWAWVPRRAGEVGALQAGAFPTLLPGGRPLADATARTQVAAAWGVDELPTDPGLDTVAQVAAWTTGELAAAVIGGVELADLPDPAAAAVALDRAFVVSLEQRHSDVTALADVVFPIALLAETSGTFVNWEGRQLAVNQVIDRPQAPLTELRVLAALAEALGHGLGWRTTAAADAEWATLPQATAPARPAAPTRSTAPGGPTAPASLAATATPTPDETGLAPDQVILASWRELLDDARLLDGADALRAGARTPVARLAPATAAALQVAGVPRIRLTTPSAMIELPLLEDPTMVEGVVWTPAHAPGFAWGAAPGSAVTITEADPS